MMTSQSREVFCVLMGLARLGGKTKKEGTAMMEHLREEELMEMPLHLQIVCLLNLWGKGADGVVVAR